MSISSTQMIRYPFGKNKNKQKTTSQLGSQEPLPVSRCPPAHLCGILRFFFLLRMQLFQVCSLLWQFHGSWGISVDRTRKHMHAHAQTQTYVHFCIYRCNTMTSYWLVNSNQPTPPPLYRNGHQQWEISFSVTIHLRIYSVLLYTWNSDC